MTKANVHVATQRPNGRGRRTLGHQQ